jgi:hypothetical protein
MTFAVLGRARTPAVRSSAAAAELLAVHANKTAIDLVKTAIDLVRLFGLDRLPARPQLVCRWHRDRDGGLACLWEPDIVDLPQR